MKTISEFRVMATFAPFATQINEDANRGANDDAITRDTLALLAALPDEYCPISNAMFYVMLHYATYDRISFDAVRMGKTFWLDHTEIKYWCAFRGNGGQINALFLTQAQGELLHAVMLLDYLDPDSFYAQLSIIADGMLPVEEYTPEELNNPLVKNFILPENSKSIEVFDNTSRFSGASWFEAIQKKKAIIAGLGGIGSYICFLLSRMQPTALYLFDDDIVEAVNMSGQLYCNADIGKYKVDAMADMMAQYASFHNVFAFRSKYTAERDTADIMICGFDNMEARKLFFDKWYAHVSAKETTEEKKQCLFIDGRLSAEYFQVFAITGDDVESQNNYHNNELFSDAEADETVCSYKQTTYMANMIGSVIVNVFTNFVANEVAGAPIRELPYLTTYDGNSMKFQVE